MRRTGLNSVLQAKRDENAARRYLIMEEFRASVLEFIDNVLTAEVDEFCGAMHSRKRGRGFYRNGSDQGSVVLMGQKIRVRKPRMKDEGGVERPLKNYEAFKGLDALDEQVCQHMMAGVSTRDYGGLMGHIAKATGISRSAVSRAFNRGSRQILDNMNGSDLSDYKPYAMMLDGIRFGKVLCVVAMGIDAQGRKRILGLREGPSENTAITSDLLQSLEERGLSTNQPILFILDGSKALKNGVLRVFGKYALIQRCIHHKQRNILECLPSEYAGEFRRRWALVHEAVRSDVATREYTKLLAWLKTISHSAYQSLLEAGEETLTVTRLGITSRLLKKTLMSTNPLESMFSFVSARVNRVKRWRIEADQTLRWVAMAGAHAQSRAHRVPGCLYMSQLIKNLHTHKIKLDSKSKVA